MEEKPYPRPPFTAAATSATEARTRCSISAPPPVQAAFLVLGRLPPPTAGAHVLAGRDGARAGRAADGAITLRVQRILGHLPLARILPDLRLAPVRERAQLEEAALVDLHRLDLGAGGRRLAAQARDPVR